LGTLQKVRKTGTKIWCDCSLFPLIAYHSPSLKILDFFSVAGCDGANSLVSIDPSGNALPCSFADDGESAFKLKEVFRSSKIFNLFRNWKNNAPLPCKACKYLNICNGGCHVIAFYETGDFYSPDPTCPIVIDFKKGVNHETLRL
jgi:radical SAM protein with 4Fe4S-binding SPASM domain